MKIFSSLKPPVVLVSLLILNACSHFQNSAHRPLDPDDFGGVISVACIGDSITYGSGLPDRPMQAYPAQLQTLLGDEWEVRNFGVSGATLLKDGNKPYWKQPSFGDAQTYLPNAVVILLGTNDSKPVNWDAHGEAFKADYQGLIDALRDGPSHPRIWLCLPPPVTTDRFTISEANLRDGIRPIIKTLALENDLPLVDLPAAFDEDHQTLHDGVHPDAAGAAIIARSIAHALAGKNATRAAQ